ncbi:MAG: ATP-binding protein [Saprospiraceae bacterium]|nr:ATP-binding protein [Saprospiraceae bacterium]
MLLHIGLLVALLLIGLYLVTQDEMIPVAGLVVLLAIVTIFSLFRLVNRTNKRLANFLMSIKYDDFEQTYTSVPDERSEKALYQAFNLINGKFRNIRLEKEMQFHYFQSLVEQVRTGLIGFDDNGKTIFMNPALQSLLHKSYFPTFDSIKRYDPDLHARMDQLQPGETELYKRHFATVTIHVAMQTTQIKLQERTFSFFSFQDIHAELQEQEVQSWQKLIRILTHEIMNSVSPVVSLAHATNDLLEQSDTLSGDTREELHAAVRAIQKRSEGLMHFTQAYRQLTRLPEPKRTLIDAVALLDRIITLMTPQAVEAGVTLIKEYHPQPVELHADAELLEQALINLLKNAVEVLRDAELREIRIGISQGDGVVSLRIADSGPGIPDHLLDQIFVPFFTTKEDGTGIGLSLARQIAQLHGGRLSVYCPADGGTEFTIVI